MAFISFEEYKIIIRIIIALLLGLALGFQREKRKVVEKNTGFAGLRTHTLVTVGSALVASIGAVMISQDPLRLAASILAGIGFIGAGTIIADRDRIKGLVNATTIWVAAATGIAVGLGYYASAILTTCIIILILELKRFEKID